MSEKTYDTMEVIEINVLAQHRCFESILLERITKIDDMELLRFYENAINLQLFGAKRVLSEEIKKRAKNTDNI